jgi:ATP-dependent exoDNAse (exonuclease V) beta subunit
MKNVHYINAGAGAGKTTTLVNKLSEILQNPDNKPAEIILTTFTKAAAKEFREKTFKQLLKDGAIQAAKSLDTATIGTVHSVAEQYIKRYWSLLGYSGQFNILADNDKNEYINHSLDTFVSADDLDFFSQYALDFKLGKEGAENWKKIIVDIISKANAYHIDFDKFTNFSNQSCDVVGRLFVHTFNMTTFKSIAHDYVEFLTDAPTNAALISKTKTAASDRLEAYNQFTALSTPTIDEISDFGKGKFFSVIAGRNKAQVDSAEKAKNYLDACRILTSANGDKVKDYIKRVFDIAGKWAQYYEDYKRKNNLLDYDDLEINFLKLLKPENDEERPENDAVRKDIQSSIKYVFVDEFQDSSPIQLEIFKELSDLVQQSYWVGDPKQAIYGFRGSDSSLTTKLLKSFPVAVPKQTSGFTPNADGCTSQLIDTSYRSIQSLVELANEVFDNSFAKGVTSEIIKDVRLNVSRPDGNIQTPIQHWHCADVPALANRVANILNGAVPTISGVYDGDGKNSQWRIGIHPSDIAILCRTKDQCVAVANALREKGIPVATPETDIMDNAEVKLIIALLKYVKHQRYAKAELSKLLEDKEFEDILIDVANGRFNYDFGDEESKKAEEITDETTTPAPPVAVAPRDLFEILDERLRNLWGLNISAIVKGIIAALDLYNVVTKWGKAATRRDNLNTLIKQAVAFEQSTDATPNSASISSFIKYINKKEIDAQLDNGVEGVKVATYHKSKGLQWKIVILYSLDNNSLEIANFVGKEWCGLNLKTDDATGKSELQLIPPIGYISKGVAEKVEELSRKPAGHDDNGYYTLRQGKATGEIKRLLYVGVTRARDYLITVSFPGTKDQPSTPLAWMKNVMGRASTAALDTIADFTTNTLVDLWGVKGLESYYEKIADNPPITYSGAKASYQKLKDTPINKETEPKRISPSGSHEKYDATASLVDGFSSDYIKHGTIKEGESAAFGTCIHNYFAVHRWTGKDKIGNNMAYNEALAATTIANHGKKKELPEPKLLTQAADALFTYLEKTFGAGELLRETPFTYHNENGQIVSGEIDLIWKTDKECILLDYKNFPAKKEWAQTTIFDDNSKNDNYVGKYFQQLDYYRTALDAAGLTVTKVFVFYAVLGCLVEIQF